MITLFGGVFLTVFSGGQTEFLTKAAAEVKGVLIAAAGGHLFHAPVGAKKKVTGMFEPYSVRVAGGRCTGELAEGLKKGGFSHSAFQEQFIHIDMPGWIVMYVADGTAQPQLGIAAYGGPVELQMDFQKDGLQKQIFLPAVQIGSTAADRLNGTE